MKKIIGILVCMLMIATSISVVGQGKDTLTDNNGDKWMKTYGGEWNDVGYMVQLTDDGCYIIGGLTRVVPDYNDFWLIKIDNMGNKIWDKTFGDADKNEACFSVKQTSDEGFILVGYKDYSPSHDSDIWLIKTDKDGNILWDKLLLEEGYNTGQDVIQTSDGGYFIIGWGKSAKTVTKVWKTDSDGNIIWDKILWGLNCYHEGEPIQQTPDGGYIITGFREINNNDVWLIKLDSDGNKLWDKTFGTEENDVGVSVQITDDDGYIICGATSKREGLLYDIDAWLIKTDSEGELIWDKKMGTSNYEHGYSVQQTSDNGYIIAGVFSDKFLYTDAFLIKTNSQGEEEWRTTFGGFYFDRVYSVQQTSDGGFITVGSKEIVRMENHDLWLIKTDSEGNVVRNRIFTNSFLVRMLERFPNLFPSLRLLIQKLN